MVSGLCAARFVHGQCFGMQHAIAVPSQSLFWDVTHHTLLPSPIVTIHSEQMHVGWVTVLGVCVMLHRSPHSQIRTHGNFCPCQLSTKKN